MARKSTFITENNVVYDGWTFDEDWNGFAVPYFEKEEADKICKDLNGKFVVNKNK